MSHAELLARHRARAARWLALYYDEPIELVDGEGRHVIDGEGHRYLDFFGGILTTMTGLRRARGRRGDPRAGRPDAAHLDALPDRPQIELAEKIAELSGIPDAKVFFTTSGHRGQRGRAAAGLDVPPVATRCSPCATATTAARSPRWASPATGAGRPSSLTPFQVSYVHVGYRFRSPLPRPRRRRLHRRLRRGPARRASPPRPPGDVACLIAEPIQGVGGFAMPPDGFFGADRRRCARRARHPLHHRRGADRLGSHRRPLLGLPGPRRHPGHAHLRQGRRATASRSPAWSRGPRSWTRSRPTPSPPSAATRCPAPAAIANLRYLLDHDLQANAGPGRRDAHDRACAPLAERHAADRRGAGQGPDDRRRVRRRRRLPPRPRRWPAPCLEALQGRGLLVGKGGLYGNCLRIAPPLSLTAGRGRRGRGHPHRHPGRGPGLSL